MPHKHISTDFSPYLLDDKTARKNLSMSALISIGKQIYLYDEVTRGLFFKEISSRMTKLTVNNLTAQLIREDLWLAWRRSKSNKKLPSNLKKFIALAWLQSDIFHMRGMDYFTHRSELNKLYIDGFNVDREKMVIPRLDSWDQIIQDLDSLGGLNGDQMKHLCSNGIQWPWIPLFEDYQLQSLAKLAMDLEAVLTLAEFVEKIAKYLNISEPAYSFVLKFSKFGNAFRKQPTALLWLKSSGAAHLPTLDLQSAKILYCHSGNKKNEAVKALICTVEKELFYSQSAPTAQNNLEKLMAHWKHQNSMDIDDFTLKLLEYIEDYTDLYDSDRMLVLQLIAAINSKKVSARCWEKLRLQMFPAICASRESNNGIHYLDKQRIINVMANLLARYLKSDRTALEQFQNAFWSLFESTQQYERCENQLSTLCTPSGLYPNQLVSLPIFNLMIAVFSELTPGLIALRLIKSNIAENARMQKAWWVELLHGLHHCYRLNHTKTTDDREEVALALVLSYLDECDDAMYRIVESALSEYRNNWPLICEIGL